MWMVYWDSKRRKTGYDSNGNCQPVLTGITLKLCI